MGLWEDLLTHQLNFIMVPLQIFIIVATFYYMILSIFGLWRKKERELFEPKKTFALVVAAHNEEKVIGPLVQNLKSLDYPDQLYDIYIVADNCSDQTATTARQAGALVKERFNLEKRGKGFALEWMFEKLFAMKKQYDGIVVFDADNLVKPNFLREMNNKLCQGHQIVQCYLDSKNPFDTWITGTFSIAFWQTNRLLQLARYNLGLSNILGGTGMCFTSEVLKRFGWGAHSLTEDLEFTMKCMLNGIKTTWAHDAVIYDEKPLTFMQSWHQRKRWAQGHVDIALRYFFKLLHRGIVDRKMYMIDGALHLFQPFLVMLGVLFVIINLISSGANYTLLFTYVMPLEGWQILTIFQFLQPVLALALDGIDRRSYKYLPFYPLFIYSWVPIVFLGVLYKNRKEWSHTVHTRNLNYHEMVK